MDMDVVLGERPAAQDKRDGETLRELCDLQLALIGGGIGETSL